MPSGRADPGDSKLRVVIVEDRPLDAELMALELARAGFNCRWVRVDTQESLLQAMDPPPDIVLADYSLPSLDAVQTMGAIREAGWDTPIIVVTGQLGDEAAAECMKLGAADYVLKDRLARLGPAVDIALQQRRLDRERRDAELALRESEQRLSLVLEGSDHGYWDVDLLSQTMLRDTRWAEMLQCSPSDLPSTFAGWLGLVHPDDRDGVASAFADNVQGRSPSFEREYRIRRPSGEWIWVLDRGKVVARDASGVPTRAAGIGRDVSEAKATRELLTESMAQLRALNRRMQAVREEERKVIAREVHDELGQALTGLKMDIAWLANRLSRLSEDAAIKALATKAGGMAQQVDTTIKTVRRICTELRPPVLDTLGLIPALEWQVRDFEQRTGITCTFSSSIEELAIDPERSTAVFRIFQEALTNVARHAHATRLDASVRLRGRLLVVRVADNGVGISLTASTGSSSLGLLGMRERAMLFGGEVKHSGRSSRGTIVTLQLPVEADCGG